MEQDTSDEAQVIGKKRPLAVVAVAVAVAVGVIWPAWAGLYTDLLWFAEIGYGVVFTTTLGAKIALGLCVGLFAALAAAVNLKLALRLSPDPPKRAAAPMVTEEGVPIPQLPDLASLIPRLAMPVSLVAGGLAGTLGWGAWDIFLRFRHQQPFGEADPIFGRDIAFYFFTLPALDFTAGLLFSLGVLILLATAAIYAVRGAAELSAGGLEVFRQRGPRAHLLGLGAALLLITAWQVYLSMPNLLYSATGPVAGAGFADITARLPALWIQVFAAVLAAVLAAVSMFQRSNRLVLVGLAAYAVAIAGGWLVPAALQRFSVAPNELVKETPYIKLNIAATRKAFGLDKVEERELSGEKELTAEDIRDNQPTIQNIRLWDQQPLLDTFGQIQEIRTYYEFQSVDNDRYKINGESTQVMLSPREMSTEGLPNRNWINETLTFTHGFGLTVGPVAKATAEGMPVLFVKDIPPESTIPALKVERPEIYYGEMSSDPVYVKTKVKEFNHPSGEENVFSFYEGDGGVSIASFWRRVMFATRFADMKMLLSNDMSADSRILFHRRVDERLRKAAPFLRFDSDPYMVISEGRLYWICDAYTVSNRYPYSQPVDRGINYIRNSVKAVLDAYHGTVSLYIADDQDPVIRTYAKIYPGILRPLGEMPADLRSHLRYPEDIFKIQTAVYSTYHMDQPQVFYNKEDQWSVASVGAAAGDTTGVLTMEPYYTVMKLPGEKKEEFIQMLPFTPQRKDNLASWMVARADGDNYGKLVVYRFPKQRLVFGPKQVVARINQDPEISRQITLWSQHGSQVILGTLMVIPIQESLVYVQPLYLRATTGKIPELRRVIVAAENRIAMEPTLDAALARVFGGALAPGSARPVEAQAPGAAVSQTTAGPGDRALHAQAQQHYQRMIQAQRDGDWARFGEELKRLGAVLQQLSEQK